MIIERIKMQTSDSHTSLENSPLLRSISEKSLTLIQYISILQKFYGFFYPMEHHIGRFPVEQYLPDFAQRRKAALLKRDLACITDKKSLPLPSCHDLPPVTNMAQAFGSLYVMEGSTLGGKMIYKVVKELLGLDEQNGLSFFYGYGAETGNKWKIFQQSLLKLSSEHTNTDDQIIDSANHTFLQLKAWIERD
jgi:heme oxygenase